MMAAKECWGKYTRLISDHMFNIETNHGRVHRVLNADFYARNANILRKVSLPDDAASL